MPEQASVTAQIQALRGMKVAELRIKWRELFGEDSRSSNRDFLWRRLAWRVQELAYGGLSERAKARLAELSKEVDLRFLPPRGWKDALEAATAPRHVVERGPVRDPRLPKPGTVLSRPYRGHDIRVTVLDHGFEWDGRPYRSLSAIAREVTGQRWNGMLFFGLTRRDRKA
jgi:Protein of unknown function (DUF2924)